MPILEPHHDFGHSVETDGAWSESYYFNGFDPDTDSGLFTRIGIRPNEGTMDVGLSLWLPGGDLAEYRAVKDQHTMVDTVLEVGEVRYEMLEPMRSWRLTFDGTAPDRACTRGSISDHDARIRLDLQFDSLTPAIGTSKLRKIRRRRRHHRQRPLRTGRYLDRLAGDRRPTVHLARGTGQPGRIVGPAPLGRPHNVALVQHQYRS
jgi:hypothetical protein